MDPRVLLDTEMKNPAFLQIPIICSLQVTSRSIFPNLASRDLMQRWLMAYTLVSVAVCGPLLHTSSIKDFYRTFLQSVQPGPQTQDTYHCIPNLCHQQAMTHFRPVQAPPYSKTPTLLSHPTTKPVEKSQLETSKSLHIPQPHPAGPFQPQKSRG